MYGMRQEAEEVQAFRLGELERWRPFGDLVGEARQPPIADQIAAGVPEAEAVGYADALALYLAFVVSRAADPVFIDLLVGLQPANERAQHLCATSNSDDMGLRRGEPV